MYNSHYPTILIVRKGSQMYKPLRHMKPGRSFCIREKLWPDKEELRYDKIVSELIHARYVRVTRAGK